MKKIAVIGVGIMGNGIATNFLKKGYAVTVWNRTREKLIDLENLGAKIATTPKEATQNADIIFEVSANDESSKVLWLGNDGILAGMDESKIAITSATLSVKWTDELAKLNSDKNYTFFDMPLTGGRLGAETGQLVLLVGGDEIKLEEIKHDLDAISIKLFYFGKAGSGMRYKLILNMVQGIHIVALGEALKVAKSSGLDIKKVGDALAERPGGTTTNLAWRDYQNEPNPINFSIEWITKDLNYAKQMADGIDTVLLDEVLEKYKKVLNSGLADSDWTAVNKF